jgi:plastocyanin
MHIRKKAIWEFVGAVAMATAVAACGGSNSSTGGNPGQPSGGGNTGTTITITTSGVNPKSITVSRGTQVTFTNNDTRVHDMQSNPHPAHTDCPEIGSVGFLAANGQSKQTGNLNIARTCEYHDHELFFNTSLQGTIIIQ